VTLSRSQAKRLADRVLSHASFGDVRVSIDDVRRGHLRFAKGQPTTEGDVEELTVTVTASKDGRSARVTSNRTDDAGLADVVKQAEELAALSPVNPEHMPPMGKTAFPKVSGHDSAAARLGAKERADIVGAAIEAAKKEGVEVAGFLSHREQVRIVADRAGLFGHDASTSVSMTTTCRTTDGTGSARSGFLSHAAAGLDGARLVLDAGPRAKASRKPERLDPGKYTVVLTADAVDELLDFLVDSMDARAAAEGRSWFSKPGGGGDRIGEALFHPSVTLFSDPTHRRHPASPFTDGGVPQGKVTWVEGGKLLALHTDRYWADKAGIPLRPRPSSIHMEGTGDDLDALIAKVERGVLVSRFWYNRMVERRTILATGLTRDGTFLIEKGRVTRPVNNFRYNESPVTMLKNVVALGKPERAPFAGGRVSVLPPIVVDGFNFESVSDAV
jgi:predicted Zn-dependent protease